jgi:hypothetical protein
MPGSRNIRKPRNIVQRPDPLRLRIAYLPLPIAQRLDVDRANLSRIPRISLDIITPSTGISGSIRTLL